MRYALLIYDRPGTYDALPDAEREAVMGEYRALTEHPAFVNGSQLHAPEMATTLRIDGGESLVTDGPFADTKEVFGGYYIVDVDDLDAALDYARRIPATRLGGAVEIRPVVERPS